MKHPDLRFHADDLEFLIPNDPSSSNQASSTSPTTAQHTTPQTRSSSFSQTPNPSATCWEILTLRLGRYARQYIEQHGADSITDKMLQSEARRILYDNDDGWEQTAADNPEWLNLFKKAHGLNTSIPVLSFAGRHEILEDLGLGSNAQLDSSFNLNKLEELNNSYQNPTARALAYEFSLAGTLAGSQAVQAASASAPSNLPNLKAPSTSFSASNLPITTIADFRGLEAPIDELECVGAGGLCIGEDGELGLTTASGRCTRGKTPTSDLACSKTLEDFMTPIIEVSCNATGGGMPGDIDFPGWDQMGDGFNLSATIAERSSKSPIISGCESMGWDDAELTFGLDMDMDLDLGGNQQL
jgi:hypothetical protein